MRETDFVEAIQKAQEIVTQHLSNDEHSHPVQVLSPMPPQGDIETASFGIIQTISKVTGYDISVFRTKGLSDPIHAYIAIYHNPDRARIVYSADLNMCWARFLMCKEAAHIFLATELNKTNTADDAIELANKLLNDSSDTDPAVKVEEIAYFAAIELIFPRQHIESAIRDFQEQGLTFLEIAVSFKVPERVVEFRLSQSVDVIYQKAYSSMCK